MSGRPTGFQVLVFASVVAAFGLIVIGGVVRVTDSGMGCGPDWPLCNGEVIPSDWTVETALEYLHRVFAGLVILFTVAIVIAGWLQRSRNRWYFVLPLVAAGVVLLQSGLGAITVLLDLHAQVTTAHHVMAQVFLATLLVLAVLASRPRSPMSAGGTRLGMVAALAAASVLAVMMMGAYTATTGAGYACPEWPLCSGYYLPGTGSMYVDVHLLHRWFAVVASAMVGLVIFQAIRSRGDESRIVQLAVGAGALMVTQVVIGAANIWTQLSPWVSAAHLMVATLTWGVLVVLVTLDRVIPAGLPAPVPWRGSIADPDLAHTIGD